MDGLGENLVQIRSLKVSYSAADQVPVRALDGVNLEIAVGEVVGILGESGCGKSTLARTTLHMLPSHARCENGTIVFRGRDLLGLPERKLRAIRGREISLIPQDPALTLNPVMTVGSQVDEVLRAHLPLNKSDRHGRVAELFEEVGFENVTDIRNAYPHQLSGGQRQRVVVAQAVACRPALLIADEPSSKLDASLQAEILGLLSQIRERYGTAILIISHNPALFAGFADRVAVMYSGRIVEVGSCIQIFRRPLHPYTQALVKIAKSAVIGASATRERFPAIEGEPADPTAVMLGCRFEPRCHERMEICTKRYPQVFTPEPSRLVNCFKYGE